MSFKLKYKIIALAIVSALLPVVVMLTLIFQQKGQLQEIIDQELSIFVQDDTEYIAKNIYGMCEIANNLLQKQEHSNLNVARKILDESGAVSLSPTEKIKWNALNQFSKEPLELVLPKMFVGGQWLGQNSNIKRPTPIVDEVKSLVGGTCTIFQRINEQGDMLRVATNVENLDGSRAIGTFIPALEPDGKKNTVCATVMSGKIYMGRAFVVNAWYSTAYEPIKDKDGNIIGCLYVGVKMDELQIIKNFIMNIRMGQSGYVTVLGGSGTQKGMYVISKGGELDGKNILDSKDENGNFFIKNTVENAINLKNGDLAHCEYPWINKGESEPRMKVAAYTYFEPWDWVIMATIYKDDLDIVHQKVASSINELLRYVLYGGVAFLAIAAVFSLIIGWKISAPIARISEMARLIAGGNIYAATLGFRKLSRAVSDSGEVNEKAISRDETGSLISSIVTMTKNLNSLVKQVQHSTIQLVSTATEIAASSKEQETTVNELGASINEIASSSEEISVTSRNLVRTMGEVSNVTNHTAELANMGQFSLQELSKIMEHLSIATDSISSKLSIINEKANNINNIVTTITKVADQTNLLSLNAAIEAEKAGEYGKGFSVVAQEIRRLADQTAVATLDIIKMVKEMQSAVSSGVMEMDKFSDEVRHGVQEGESVSDQFEKIIKEVQGMPPIFNDVIEGMEQQSEGAHQISESMSQLSDAARQTTDSVREFNEATRQMNNATQVLQKEVSIFKVN